MILPSIDTKIHQSIKVLSNSFQTKDLSNLTKFLVTKISKKSFGIWINEEDIIITLCEDMGISYRKGGITPIADNNMIDLMLSQLYSEKEAIKYRSAVGTLLHITNMTRLDIQHTVN